jgi:hypothetical protein
MTNIPDCYEGYIPQSYIGLTQVNSLLHTEFTPLRQAARLKILNFVHFVNYLEAFPLPDPEVSRAIISIFKTCMAESMDAPISDPVDVTPFLKENWRKQNIVFDPKTISPFINHETYYGLIALLSTHLSEIPCFFEDYPNASIQLGRLCHSHDIHTEMQSEASKVRIIITRDLRLTPPGKDITEDKAVVSHFVSLFTCERLSGVPVCCITV